MNDTALRTALDEYLSVRLNNNPLMKKLLNYIKALA